MTMRVDADDVERLSALARLLPVIAMHPQSDDLLLGTPDHRRRFLDRIGFYSSASFQRVHADFQRALKQRNALLRRQQSLASWDRLFIDTALRLEQERRAVLASLSPRADRLMTTLMPGSRIGLRYLPGYRQDLSLEAAIAQGTAREQEQATSLFGPHRADLRVALDEHDVRQNASRGQIKMLVTVLHLTVLDLWADVRGEPAVVLFDDLASELDAGNRRRVLEHLVDSGHQVFVSVIAADAIDGEVPIAARFHVADGQVDKVV
jgi:DNA replication and repair protein RecF